MKLSFYTMIGDLQNVHIIKDVGMFPFILAKEGYFDSYIVSYGRAADDFPNLSYTPDLKLVVRKKVTGSALVDGCLWLISNAKKIDILNLYHFRFSSFMWILIYKLFNYHGKIWLKLDMNPSSGMKMRMKGVKRLITKMILGQCEVVSSETREFQSYANERWPIKVSYVPNGICLANISTDVIKEKIILTVGRLGTKQKATEILVEAFVKSIAHISEHWTLKLIGAVEESFQNEMNKLFHSKPYLRERITLLGQLNDRDVLTSYYEKAMIFTMPSRWEGFCLVGIEAISKGDYLLTSDLISFKELTNNWKYGTCFTIDNVQQYAKKIVELCNKIDGGVFDYDKKDLSDFLSREYCYENICKRLYLQLCN